MEYETINSRNLSEGLHIPLVYVNDITNGLFVNLFLFVIFMAVLFGTFFSAKRISGDSNLVSSFAIAGYVTSGAAIIMSLIPNLIPLYVVIITIVISLIGTIWLFFQNIKDR